MDIISNFNLPQKIQDHQLRTSRFGGDLRLMYSKDGSFLMPSVFSKVDLKLEQLAEYKRKYSLDVLYEVGAPGDLAVHKLKEKVYLNQQIPEEFENIMGYDTTFALDQGEHIVITKFFEVYAILDFNSNSVFFACVSVFPERDYKMILNYINGLRSRYNSKGIDIKFNMPDCNSKDLHISNKIHILSFSADGLIEKIRNHFKTENWNVKLLNEQHFIKRKQEYIQRTEQFILCEGKNKSLLNGLNISNTIFSDEHNSLTIFQNVKTMVVRCLRDKDFLTSEEVMKLRRKFPKYHILDFYCLENYLYHPENISSFLRGGFNEEEYKSSIVQDKNRKLDSIIEKIDKARNTYPELKENHIKPSKDAKINIIRDLESNEFSRFYKHFDMKRFNKSYLEKYKLTERKLSSTEWFKIRISAIIEI